MILFIPGVYSGPINYIFNTYFKPQYNYLVQKGIKYELSNVNSEKKMDKKNIDELTKLFKKLNISEDPKKFKRYGSSRNLYNFKIDNVGAY